MGNAPLTAEDPDVSGDAVPAQGPSHARSKSQPITRRVSASPTPLLHAPQRDEDSAVSNWAERTMYITGPGAEICGKRLLEALVEGAFLVALANVDPMTLLTVYKAVSYTHLTLPTIYSV